MLVQHSFDLLNSLPQRHGSFSKRKIILDLETAEWR